MTKQRREALHQPPNPADLQRVPPASPVCARIRGLLRDYVDNDLTSDLGRAVEEHAHVCRVCAVELARAEHEVLQLRRAFLAQKVSEPELSHGFAARVLDRVVLSDGMESDGMESDGASDQHWSDAEHRGGSHGDDVGRERERERDGALGSPAGMLVAGLFCLFVLGVGVRIFTDGEVVPASIARLIVLFADDTYDGRQKPLGMGDWLGEQQSLWVARGGAARMNWVDASSRAQPAAVIEMQGGEMRLQNGAPMLVDGKVLIETNRPVEIPMSDGSRIALGKGEYMIAAEIPYDMLSGELAESWASGEDPLSFMPVDLEIEVEVLGGQPATVFRTGWQPTLVQAGNVGVYRGGVAVDVGPSGPAVAGNGGDDRTAVQDPPATVSRLSGHVTGPGGLPSVGAVVFLSFASQDIARGDLVITGSDGRFELQTDFSCDSDFAVVQALNPVRQDLGYVAPHAVEVWRQGQRASLSAPVPLDVSTPLFGVVRDAGGQGRGGVVIMPCIVDELFGTVMLLDLVGRSFTDEGGNFRVEKLPSRLPAHQALVLLLWHPELEAAIVPVPQRGSPVAATAAGGTLVARSLQTVRLHQLPGNSGVTILEEVRGLPAGTAVVKRQAQTDGQGRVDALAVGRGRLWLRTGPPGARVVDALELDSSGGAPRYRPAGEPLPIEQMFRTLQALPDSDVGIANSYRHKRFRISDVENASSELAVITVDDAGQPMAGVEVFAIERGGPRGSITPRFLGFTRSNGVLSLGPLAGNENVVAIGADGSFGAIAQPGNEVLLVTLPLQRTGRVLLHESLRPSPTAANHVATIRFVRLNEGLVPGLRPAAWRFAADTNGWEVEGLPAGAYRAEVAGQSIEIVVPPMGFVELQ